MGTVAEDRSVTANVRYIRTELRDAATPPSIGSRESRRANTAIHEVTVFDARATSGLELDRNGFTITQHQTTSAGADEARIKSDYYAEMLGLVRHSTGADRVYMMGHQVRTEDSSNFNNAYARFVHCDYSLKNAGSMSQHLLEREQVSAEPGWRYAWYNTWQPFDNEVQQNPLAMLAADSLAANDVIGYYYSGYEDTGNLVSAPVYNPAHRWYYYPHMSTSEVLLLKQIDTRDGRAPLCPHTSFNDATAPSDALPRRSVETRIMAVFETAA